MPEENKSQPIIQTRRVEPIANVSIWCAGITWGFVIVFLSIAVFNSYIPEFLEEDFDSIAISVFYLSMISNLLSLIGGIIGLIRCKIKRKEYSGIYRALIAIILSIVFFSILVLFPAQEHFHK